MKPTHTIKELKAAWLGKTFHAHDSFNGDNDYFTIDDIKRTDTGGVRVSHTNEYGNTVKYHLGADEVDALMSASALSHSTSIDACFCTRRITIYA